MSPTTLFLKELTDECRHEDNDLLKWNNAIFISSAFGEVSLLVFTELD